MSKKIKLLVEVDESDYEALRNGGVQSHIALADEIIANGTPLPKGHGRLIEEPTETDILNIVGGNNDFAECIRDSVKAVFDNATTIIEADMENDK